MSDHTKDLESQRVAAAMDSLLTDVANALKGPPLPRGQHSWHDLADLAGKLTAQLAAISELHATPGTEPTCVDCGRRYCQECGQIAPCRTRCILDA